MRLGGEGPSGNFEDRTGQGGGLGFGGGGGNMLGCLLPFVLSRFGIVGVVILLLGYCALTQLGGGGGGLLPGGPSTSSQAGRSTLDPNMRDFLTRVLGSTEETWGEIFQKSGERYTPTKMVAYSGGTQTACGFGQAVMGPFYCPNDKSIYIDPDFFNELSQRFGAPGDFAMAYVVAHEVGHHIQDLEGTLDQAHNAQAGAGEAQGNAIQVKVELQADCYAGVWAANARDAQGKILEPGDVEEGMRAAEAIGDDTLQRKAQGTVVPESFTHGTSAQRMEALRRGLQGGDPALCRF
ncbi:KPN_02809 family neutral zinc metallopeptidase [Sphingomonas hankyongi]|uniref:Neutral zinc metallopeptidase n=1 Tax=Sphingomonas hankyongi TaxID=2908209 RepID=A0ABT0S1K4_9SPHN|nr:neutral zinc metallopeptidase [Sphingomonas hankyongi]MCL6729672.1 neutral zinc metallopeptidase [Sphingomonas hankyongi]